jgi:outer membrane protein OmpA-like peptidoglycan-associated protein
MAVNLLDLIGREIGDDAISAVASAIGESSGATRSAMGSLMPAILGGLMSKASTAQGASDLLKLAEQSGLDGSKFGTLASAASALGGIHALLKLGAPLLPAIFGPRQNSVTDWLSSAAGLNRNAANSLLSIGAPFVLNWILKYLRTGGNYNAAGLGNLLGSQSAFLRGVAPAGLAQVLGIDLGDAGRAAAAAPAAARGSSLWKWLLPLIALLLLFWLWKGRRQEEPVATTPEPQAPPAEVAPATPAPVFVIRGLPSGVKLNVPENGIESQLIAFIEDANRPVDKTTWFSFDRLEFETASAVLMPRSQEQLKNIADILSAYPQVEIKIGGYTDSVGDDAANMKLSQDRATNTMNALVQLGVAPARMAAEGYGEQFPVASNDTEEGRQRNRRIDLRVTKK